MAGPLSLVKNTCPHTNLADQRYREASQSLRPTGRYFHDGQRKLGPDGGTAFEILRPKRWVHEARGNTQKEKTGFVSDLDERVANEWLHQLQVRQSNLKEGLFLCHCEPSS